MSEPCKSTDTLDREIAALRRELEVRVRAVEQTAEAEHRVILARFEQANEWRLQLDKERADFVRHAETGVTTEQIRHLGEHIKTLQSWQDRADGALRLLYILAITGAIGAVFQVIRSLSDVMRSP